MKSDEAAGYLSSLFFDSHVPVIPCLLNINKWKHLCLFLKYR